MELLACKTHFKLALTVKYCRIVSYELDERDAQRVCVSDLALLAVQVELVLADGHGPDGLDEAWTGVPGVDRDAAVSERPPRHRRPAVRARNTRPWLHTTH